MSGTDPQAFTVRTVTAATTMTANDYVLIATASSAYAVTLPDSETGVVPGRPYLILKDAGANAITITPADAADTINGATTMVLASGAFHGAQLINTGDVWVATALY